jgi:esterase/lipase superfamily enzyme
MALELAGAPKSLTVFYATNRRRDPDSFHPESGQPPDSRTLWLGKASVEWLGDPANTEGPRGLLAHPEIPGDDDFANPDKGPAAKLLDAWLDNAFAREAVALFFVHGFSNSFTTALTRAAQIAEFHSGHLALAPFAFSWPSDGRVFDPEDMLNPFKAAMEQYKTDQKDAWESGGALGRLLREIHRARLRADKRKRRPRMVLLAHSMGNLALAAGLAAMRHGLMTTAMAGTFEHAALVAADVPDAMILPPEPLGDITLLADAVTVVISDDGMLRFASKVANDGSRRLGHYGPPRLDLLPPQVTVVDYVAGLQSEDSKPHLKVGGTTWDTVNHQYYRNDIKARVDIAAILAGTAPPTRDTLAPTDQVLPFSNRRSRHAVLRFTGV